jgi:NAD(P)-dependent dehydrogenase (short-subunit alcohol dehydrogenase family)
MKLNNNPFSLEGKTVLVTGASSGIGKETAIQCSKMGAKLIITARNEERLNETLSQLDGDGHRMILAELTNPEDLEKLVGTIDSLNGLVLSAGQSVTTPILFSTRDKFNSVFETNFFAPVELLRLLLKKRKLVKDSSVVFVSSIGGVKSINFGNGIYGASKAAVNSIMKFCAKEFAAKRIRVNSVNPGRVNTNMIQNGVISEEQQKMDVETYPLKRYGEPQEIAYGIIYLLSDAASWVTGHSLVIDGGKTI